LTEEARSQSTLTVQAQGTATSEAWVRATARARATATATSNSATARPAATKKPRPAATPTPSYPAPILVAPEDGFDAGSGWNCEANFEWRYPRVLVDDEAFQVLIWATGQPEHNGVAEFTTRNEQLLKLCMLVRYFQIVPRGKSPYLWSVVLVQNSTGRRLSPEAPPRFIGFQP
jgi:hypothetical protein